MSRPPIQSRRPALRRRLAPRTVSAPPVEGWELLELAASGTFTDVFRARPADRKAELPAAHAVKVLKQRWLDRPEIVALLHREAEVAGCVRHPHLISVLSANTTVQPAFVVTPWLPGETLRHRLQAPRPIDIPVALWYARQAAEALDALQQAGWRHGDVKPSNLIVSPEGHVTLLDLGFAQPLGAEDTAVDRPVMGSFQYMAPELFTSRLAADSRSDFYSLGAVLFQMLTGDVPFAGRTMEDMVVAHRSGQPSDLRRLVPALPAGVTRLVRELLAKNPARRPARATEIVERLATLEIATFAHRACHV